MINYSTYMHLIESDRTQELSRSRRLIVIAFCFSVDRIFLLISTGPEFFMDLSRAKTELSNEYKIFEIQAETSLHFSFTKYSITLSIIIFSIFIPFFSCIFDVKLSRKVQNSDF
jgi:hypothetical protein